MKKCKKCGIEKSLTEFGKRTASKDGLMYNCKQCKKEEYENNKEKRKDYLEQYRKRPEVKERKKKYNKEYNEKNAESLKEYRKNYNKNNKERMLLRDKEYNARPEVKERKKKYNKDYRSKNLDKIKAKQKEHYEKNKELILEKDRIYRKRPEIQARDKMRRKKYYAQNKEHDNARSAAYQRKNKEKLKIKAKERREMLNSLEPGCVYQIINLINGKVYIGETTRGKLRWKQHLQALKRKKHENLSIQKDYDSYGEDAFEWSIIKDLPKDKNQLLLEEAREIQRRINNGEDLYNLVLTVEQLKLLNENQEKK